VDATMNYRKRGLRYFSGFDFDFTGNYSVANTRPHDIDVAFVFPIEMDKAQVLLSDLQFLVDGQPAPLEMGEQRNRLVWTGRIDKGAERQFTIRYRARGLDSFLYRLDPSLPANDVKLHVGVVGGDNFDYPAGALSASSVALPVEIRRPARASSGVSPSASSTRPRTGPGTGAFRPRTTTSPAS
jgi:hypothetical protein